MAICSQIVSYVADTAASAALYARILDQQPMTSGPGFATFALPGGTILALRDRDAVQPRATLPGGTELGFPVASADKVRLTRDTWARLGLRIIQEPVQLEFGYTFTAADPDGHRLRVFSPA